MSNGSKFSPTGKFFSPGFIGSLGESGFGHRLGGKSWVAKGPRQELGNPTLLAVIDLADPVLSAWPHHGFHLEIPLFTYTNCDGLITEQEYVVDEKQRAVRFTKVVGESGLLPPEDRVMVPIPETKLELREMTREEIPSDEESYWRICDSFLGGSAFIRIFGVPVFTESVENLNEEFYYAASIGYESYDKPKGYLPQGAFFFGELAFYFFVSKGSNPYKIKVITQST